MVSILSSLLNEMLSYFPVSVRIILWGSIKHVLFVDAICKTCLIYKFGSEYFSYKSNKDTKNALKKIEYSISYKKKYFQKTHIFCFFLSQLLKEIIVTIVLEEL